jgi:hypothetical protein
VNDNWFWLLRIGDVKILPDTLLYTVPLVVLLAMTVLGYVVGCMYLYTNPGVPHTYNALVPSMTGVVPDKMFDSLERQYWLTLPPLESMYGFATPRNPPAACSRFDVVVKYTHVVPTWSVNNRGVDWTVPIPESVIIVSLAPPPLVVVLSIT